MSSLEHTKVILLPMMILLFYGGCVPRGTDGRYHSVYSYHPYNKMYLIKKRGNTSDTLSDQQSFFIPPKFDYRDKLPSHPIPSKPLASNGDNFLLQIESLAKSQLGKRYRWGANGPYDFDCSGFTKFVYGHHGVTLPRLSREQAKVGRWVDLDHLKKGDLIFFDSAKSSKISHTGIYLGNHQFIHASSSKKRVVVSDLRGYYKKHFKWGRRVRK